ncbi:MAG: VWA domain-containing protein [Bacteroidetes bacterium]|nr:VWA domain-containing protein [Bacteroidota bacterium]
MFRFEHTYFAYGFLLLILFVVLYLVYVFQKKRLIKLLGDPSLVERLMPLKSKNKPLFKFIITQLAFILLVLVLMNPQIGSRLQEVKREGADIIIALDVSNSMKAEDIQPNRLTRSKQAIEKLIDKLEGDRIGLIVFAGEAFVQLPITTDYAAAKLFLQNIDTDIVPTQGTAVGAAIDLAIESFGDDVGKNRALIILTDGENHEDDAIASAKTAVEKNIIVHTIGIGSVNGTPIPVYKNNIQTGFKKDKDGNTVITKLNEVALQEISAAGNGSYVRATNSDVGLNSLLNQLRELDKKQFESKMYTDYDDKFQYFALPALLLLLIEFLIGERKSLWIKKLNLFGENNKEIKN